MGIQRDNKLRHKQDIKASRAARAKLVHPHRFAMKNETLFQTVAKVMGVTWQGTRRHGFDLCYAFTGLSRDVEAKAKRPSQKVEYRASDAFLASFEWRRLRMEVIKARGTRCECCGRTPKQHGIAINVDHIKPRKHYPDLALEQANLQVLCDECNHGKGNWDETDWRTPQPVVDFSPCWTKRVQ